MPNKQLEEIRVTSAHSLGMYFKLAGKICWQQKPQAAGHITSTIGMRKRYVLVLSLVSPFY